MFVYGALRSGTTLLRLMLDNHPRLSNPGEFDFLFDYLTFDGADGHGYDAERLSMDRMFVDFRAQAGLDPEAPVDIHGLLEAMFAGQGDRVRTLNIHRNLNRVLRVFKSARFIHIIRDPRAVADSSKRMGWGGNLYTALDHWLGTEAEWSAAALPPDRYCEVRFEDLLADPERHLSRVCAFLGVEYHPAMLRYHEQSSYGKPNSSRAASAAQVMDWTLPYAEWKCASRMQAAGYMPRTTPIRPGPLRRQVIRWDSKLKNFFFACERYGVSLTLAHRLSRYVRLRPLSRLVFERMAVIDRRHLK